MSLDRSFFEEIEAELWQVVGDMNARAVSQGGREFYGREQDRFDRLVYVINRCRALRGRPLMGVPPDTLEINGIERKANRYDRSCAAPPPQIRFRENGKLKNYE